MQAQRTFQFCTKAYGKVTIHAKSVDLALEEFLQRGYLESDIIEIR